jgi:hypothetical protein
MKKVKTDDQEFKILVESLDEVHSKEEAESLLKAKGLKNFALQESLNGELKVMRVLLG